jgi:transcriptional regulator with XRE-family HTH domain
MRTVNRSAARTEADTSAVADYKRILQQVLENRPSGTRRRLAEALGKNRSFISQITNPTYTVPIPARHIESIFEICHFLGTEKAKFLQSYERAHPHRVPKLSGEARWRELVLRLPDLHDAKKNRELDDLLKETIKRIVRMFEER